MSNKNIKCDYGCNQISNFKFKNGKNCCKNNWGKCPGQLKNYKKRNKLSALRQRTEIDPVSKLTKSKLAALKGAKTRMTKIDKSTGLTIAQLSGIKQKETKDIDIDENGLNAHQRIGIKQKETKNNILNEWGLNIHQLSAIKSANTMKKINPDTGESIYSKNGKKISKSRNIVVGNTNKTVAQIAAVKANITKNNNIDPITGLNINKINGLKLSKKLKSIEPVTGKTYGKLIGKKTRKTRLSDIGNYQRAAIKALETKLKDIDPITGLNGIERNRINFPHRKIYKNTNLYTDSTYEIRFLEKQEKIFGCLTDMIKNVSRGPSIKYKRPEDAIETYYFSDFLIKNTIYEIKSSYTWREWHGVPQEEKNKAKLNAALNNGYNVILVLDDVEIIWDYDTII